MQVCLQSNVYHQLLLVYLSQLLVAVQVETISGEVLTLDIYDRIGAKVKSMTYVLYAAENGFDIDISDLEEGTYFLSFESSMGTEPRKLVVVQ